MNGEYTAVTPPAPPSIPAAGQRGRLRYLRYRCVFTIERTFPKTFQAAKKLAMKIMTR